MSVYTHGNSKVNERQIAEIRALYASGQVSQIKLSKQFGLAQSAISKLVHGQSHAHIPLAGPVRCCADCGIEIVDAGKRRRCDPCRQKWLQAYRREYDRTQRKRGIA